MSINSSNKNSKHALFFINNCLRRQELNACGEERKAVKTRKQTDPKTYFIKSTDCKRFETQRNLHLYLLGAGNC